ncbi:MAG: signal peptidase I [Leptospiraceae bacterium]|nr:signal peptidase I [Leptospiraceae bacterium]
MVYVYKAKEVSNFSLQKITRRLALVVTLALSLGYLTKRFFFFAHKVQTKNMLPSVQKDEIIYLTKIFGNLEYETVVMAYTQNPKKVFFAKVIGIEGDKISIKNKKIYRNGKQLEFNVQLTDKRIAFPKELSKRDNLESVTVGKNEYFLLCENQDECLDSRDVGLVRRANIIGKKIF